MEEIQAYIETGILELYVIGQLTAQEQLEVEQMAVKHPLVKEEINAIEVAMEKYAFFHAVNPTAGLENKIFDEISAEVKPIKEETVKDEAVIVQFNPDKAKTTIRSLKYALVACMGLLVISVVALYYAHSSLNVAKQQIAELNIDNERFATTVSYIKAENKDLQQIAQISSDPTWTSVKLAGTEIAPKANMVVYWHKKGQHVMVDITKMTLPENDAAHQYQLWAMVNGKPVDLGVFDAKAYPKKLLVAMKEIGAAQAFAVTLEKRGGSINPTMNKLVALGGISI